MMSISQSQTWSQSHSQLPAFLAKGDPGTGLFNRKMGPLQRQLRHGEYDLFRFAPMLESDFVQVSKRGEVIDVHNQVEPMTVAVACVRLLQETPDVLLLARSVSTSEENLAPLKTLLCQYPPPRTFELTSYRQTNTAVADMVYNQETLQSTWKGLTNTSSG